MDLERFREFCLSLGEVEEKMPFGKFAKRYDSILVFYVCGHMFAFVDIDNFTWVNVRLTARGISEIREKYTSVESPLNQSLKYWIQLLFNGDIPDNAIYDLVHQSFETVRQKYRKKSS